MDFLPHIRIDDSLLGSMPALELDQANLLKV